MDWSIRRGRFAVMMVTALVALCPASAAARISHARATAIALHILRPARAHGPTVLFTAPVPVRAGSSVVESAPGASVRAHPLTRAAWLYWEDEDYESLFEHPSVLLLVDAGTGRIIRRQAMSWFPLVDGRRPVFLASLDAYHDPRHMVFTSHLPTAAPVAAIPRAGRDPIGPPVIKPGELRHDCLIMLGDRQDPILAGSFAAMLDWAKRTGVTAYPDQAIDLPSLRTTLNVALAHDCDDVVLFVAGHGTPPPGWVDPASGVRQPGGPPSLSLNLSAARAGQVPDQPLTPQDLRAVISDYPMVDFKVEIESCFAGRWVGQLGGIDPETGRASTFARNLVDLGLSSGADQTSKGQITLTKYDRHGRVIEANVPATDNPWHAGEFTNGISHGLGLWAADPVQISRTGGDLAAGADAAASLGLRFNAATSLAVDVLPRNEHADPLFFGRRHHFRVKLAAHEVTGGVSISGWTHGRFDTVTASAPSDDTITSFDAHGHRCVAVDEAGNEYPPDSTGLITIPAPHRWVAVRCTRKPTDNDISIAVTLASGSGRGKTVGVVISGGSEPYGSQLPVSP